MDPQQYAEAVHDEAPPAYGYPYGYELPAMPLHELSDRLMLAPELEGDDVFAELEVLMERTQDRSLESDTSQASFLDLDEIDERGATPVGRSPTTADEPMLLWTLNTQYQSVSVPSMTSGRQSRKSSPSPVSPVTPNVNGICSAQFYSDANRPASTVSPLESFPPNDFDLPRSFRMDTDWNHASFEANHVESFRGNAQQPAKGLDGRRDDPVGSSVPFSFANHESHVPGLQSPPALGQSLPELRSQWHGATGIRYGTYECSDHQGWQFRGGYEQDAPNDGHVKCLESTSHELEYAHRFGGSQGPSTNYIELEDHQDPQFCEAPEQDEVNSPLAYCDKCGKSFRGSSVAHVVGSACRICEKAYKRTDATRKHEWKKHRIPDAMPKKRTK
ncbi:hypothetical protein J4E93_007800 [Alternaria ventricosa]|uniref:uncharacterized protein n=1 Tax=Alternaria ventricosa TaxID=1187951 RepID=UPI0020C2099C|nr:uncharacterized protein J4E93_007800 [Alternaria ventricosa]KAI4641702.1 hypothetical protein J4E93_007800 [Alternaria ventricosa]